MALNIKSPETDRLARELAAVTGEKITVAVSVALRERLARIQHYPQTGREYELDAIWRRASRLCPRLEGSDNDLMGYNDQGTLG